MWYLRGIFVTGTYFVLVYQVNVVVYQFMMDVCRNVGLYVYYSRMQWDIYVQCDRYIYSGTYISNVECMHASAAGHIVHCSEFI